MKESFLILIFYNCLIKNYVTIDFAVNIKNKSFTVNLFEVKVRNQYYLNIKEIT